MDTEELNFRFFFKKKELPYIQTYIRLRKAFKKKQLFSRTVVSETKHKQFKTKLTI